jgi:hypothetical protein
MGYDESCYMDYRSQDTDLSHIRMSRHGGGLLSFLLEETEAEDKDGKPGFFDYALDWMLCS